MAWRVEWRSPQMTAPAFWYYRTKTEADVAAANLRRGGSVASVHRTKMTRAMRELLDSKERARSAMAE